MNLKPEPENPENILDWAVLNPDYVNDQLRLIPELTLEAQYPEDDQWEEWA